MPAMNKRDCTLIITTYNWPAALRKCLQSVAWQSKLPAEVIVADDGSNNETAELIIEIKKTFPTSLIHLSQENKGRRKTRINNIAIATAKSSYLVFVDHDMVLHPHFIKDHLSLAQKGYFLNGSRFLIGQPATSAFLQQEKFTLGDLQKIEGKNTLNKLRAPWLMNLLAHRYRTKESDIMEVRGCNMSFWREDLISVNGYDEAYMEWGREDSNIAIRLFNRGIKKKSLKFGGIAFHLHHPFASREDDAMNLKMLMDTKDNKEDWAPLGLNQHMK
jgi:glycosyltransferase involved in cell wall biosynthesis